jgi:Ion channel
MLAVFLSACVLSGLTVLTHASGIAVLLRGLGRLRPTSTSLWFVRRTLLRIIWWLVVLHLAEIAIWGFFYHWRGCLPDAETAFYFSASSYTTLGYGDVLLTKPWRMLGPIESLLGVLMFGLSTGYFFVAVNRIYQPRQEKVISLPDSGG